MPHGGRPPLCAALSALTVSALLLLTPTPGSANSQLASAALAFVDVCLVGFPDKQQMRKRASAAKLEQAGEGRFKGDGFSLTLPASAGRADDTTCSMIVHGRVERRDLSDAIQATLDRSGIRDMSVLRRGVRLDVEFTKGGTDGWMRTERLGGISSMAIVMPRARTR